MEDSKEEREIKNQLAYKLFEYSKNVPSDPDYSKFIFTIINKIDSKIAVLFIKEHNINYLYATAQNRPYTPLMLAVEAGLLEIVNRIILKIKDELCKYYITQITNLNNEILNEAFSSIDISMNPFTKCIGNLCNTFTDLNILNKESSKEDHLKIKISEYENNILLLEQGVWPSSDILMDIKQKIGFFKALEISKIKNNIATTIDDISDIFTNYNNQEILKLLSTCPNGKCWTENKIKRQQKAPTRKNITVKSADKNTKENLLRDELKKQKIKREKNMIKKKIERKQINTSISTDSEEDIDAGYGKRKKTLRKKRKSGRRKKASSGKRKKSKSGRRKKASSGKRKKSKSGRRKKSLRKKSKSGRRKKSLRKKSKSGKRKKSSSGKRKKS
jgi:hypothetical protein